MQEKNENNTKTIHRLGEYITKSSLSFNKLAIDLGLSNSYFSKMVKNNGSIGSDILEKILRIHPDLNPTWLLTGNGFMLEEEKSNAIVSYEPAIGVPYYDVDFVGGFDLMENDQTIIPAHNIVFKQYENATLWCNITGNSMAQKINHGDIIALQELHSLEDVLYGEIYAVVLDTLRTVKILRKSSNPNKLRFIPVNTAEYDEQEFDKNRIIKLYAVLGSISKFF